MNSRKCPEKNKHLHDLANDNTKGGGMGNVHICAKTKAVQVKSVFDDIGILVLRCQFQLFLPLHVAVPSHHAQVASVDSQQHHRGGKGPIADVSQALPSYHDEDPEGARNRKSEQVQQRWKVTAYVNSNDTWEIIFYFYT